jgi:pimeloyl-ACP methyl ester carboxylesterase
MTQDQNQASAPAAPLGEFAEAGGRRLWLHRSGQGGPAVVFLPGASAVGLDYLNVHEQAAGLTTSVLYDRGGTGWSDPAPLPRTAAEVASELRELLRAADVPGPYLLAAHSLGGAYARRFGQLFPDDLAGIAYLDGFYEESDAYLPEKLQLARLPQPDPGALALKLARPAIRRMYTKMLASWPAAVREVLLERHLSEQWWRSGVAERGSLVQVADELKAGGPVPDRPVIVLATLGVDAGMRLMMRGKTLRDMTEGHKRMYTALAGSVTHGEVRFLDDARHSTIVTDRPDAVVAALRDLRDVVRADG